MCLALHRLPHELDEMDDADYWQFREFMRVERAAGRLKKLQNELYG